MSDEIKKLEKTINESINIIKDLLKERDISSPSLRDIIASLKDYNLFIEHKEDGMIQIYNAKGYNPAKDNEFWRIMGWDLNKETLREQSLVDQKRFDRFLTQNNV